MPNQRVCMAIDLKSFYASVECQERCLDPLTTNLVVADVSRTEKTICLAVSPSLKAYGIPGRARLFEVIQAVKEINAERLRKAPGHHFTGKSSDAKELAADPSLELSFIAAPPQMKHYMKVSTDIYQVYLKYIAPEDIHVYSVDEVFLDASDYLATYRLTPRQLAMKMIREIMEKTGITATAGIGTNLYLAKVAMDIEAKHVPADENGVRIAELTELSYRKLLWDHRPLTDFWRVGRGYARKLEEVGLYTMGDIALCSTGGPNDFYSEELLYRMFGINAEFLIDHAWGWEPCTISAIKAYKPENESLGSGQVLTSPYPYEKARLIVREMTDYLALDLVDKGLVTNQLVLSVGYDISNVGNEKDMVTGDGGRKMATLDGRKMVSGGGGSRMSSGRRDSWHSATDGDRRQTTAGSSRMQATPGTCREQTFSEGSRQPTPYGKNTSTGQKSLGKSSGQRGGSAGEIVTDRYGRKVPKPAHGSINLPEYTSSSREIIDAMTRLFERIVDPNLTVRRIYVIANHVCSEKDGEEKNRKARSYEQLSLFTDYEAEEKAQKQAEADREKERRLQQAVLDLKKKFGKNAVLRGMNLEEGSTAIQRNNQVGGHRAE